MVAWALAAAIKGPLSAWLQVSPRDHDAGRMSRATFLKRLRLASETSATISARRIVPFPCSAVQQRGNRIRWAHSCHEEGPPDPGFRATFYYVRLDQSLAVSPSHLIFRFASAADRHLRPHGKRRELLLRASDPDRLSMEWLDRLRCPARPRRRRSHRLVKTGQPRAEYGRLGVGGQHEGPDSLRHRRALPRRMSCARAGSRPASAA